MLSVQRAPNTMSGDLRCVSAPAGSWQADGAAATTQAKGSRLAPGSEQSQGSASMRARFNLEAFATTPAEAQSKSRRAGAGCACAAGLHAGP